MTTKWLVLASLAAMLSACANVDRRGVAMVEQVEVETEGEAIAAQLGYHGPARPTRPTQRMGAGAAP